MAVISFQGLCYFRQDDIDGVDVYLPAADLEEKHQDGRVARPHRAAIFVTAGLERAVDGFTRCLYRPQKGAPVRGWQFELCPNGRSGPLSVEVDGQGTKLTNKGDLKDRIVSFSKCTNDLPKSFAPKEHAAVVRITGGTFGFRDSGRTWKINRAFENKPTEQEPLGEPAYAVDWALESYDTWITIKVKDGLKVLASIEVRGADIGLSEVVIGNLDHPNPAQWPRRPNQLLCEPADYDTNANNCYDADFKWFYRLFKAAEVQKVTRHHPLPSPFTDKSVVPGYDTPTCFPGGD